MVDVCRADAGPVTMSTVTLAAAAKVTIKTATTVDRIVASAESADSSCDVVKTGAGNLLIEAAGGTLKSLAVEAGTVKLGTFGMDNRFWRATYKQAMTAGRPLYIGPLRLFTKNNASADGGATRDRETVSNYVDKMPVPR